MARSASLSTLPSAYNDFLYAVVGEDRNGASVTVLSVLARQNLDPWAEAAELSQLPRDTAARRLISMITASALSTTDQTTLADRLIALLSSCVASSDGASNAVQDAHPPVQRPPPGGKLVVIAIYIGLMILGQWIAASVLERAPLTTASASSPPSTPAETPPNDDASH
jgi:hypothetical protein